MFSNQAFNPGAQVQGGVYSPGDVDAAKKLAEFQAKVRAEFDPTSDEAQRRLNAALQMADREPGAVLSAIDRLAALNDNLHQLAGKLEANLDRLSGMRAQEVAGSNVAPVQDGEVNLLHSKISTSFDLAERLLIQADRLTNI